MSNKLLPFLWAGGAQEPATPPPTVEGKPNFYSFLRDIFGLPVLDFVSVPSYGTEYFISPSGSDVLGNGTINNPWKTLFKALSMWNASGNPPGTCVWVRAGNYKEYLSYSSDGFAYADSETTVNSSAFLNGKGGILGQELVIRGWIDDVTQGLIPVFDGSGIPTNYSGRVSDSAPSILGWSGASSIKIYDIEFQDSAGSVIRFDNSPYNVNVSHVHINQASGHGIEIIGGSNHEVVDVLVHHAKYGISVLSATNSLVHRAISFKNLTLGFEISNSDTTIESGFTWGNGWVYGTESSSLWKPTALTYTNNTAPFGSLWGISSSGGIVRDCISFGNYGDGFHFTGTSLGYNNTAYKNTQSGFSADGTSVWLANNISYNNTAGNVSFSNNPYAQKNTWSNSEGSTNNAGNFNLSLTDTSFTTVLTQPGFLQPSQDGFANKFGFEQSSDWTSIPGWASVDMPSIEKYLGAVNPVNIAPPPPTGSYDLTPEAVIKFNLPYWQPLERPSWVTKTVWISPNGTQDGTSPTKTTSFVAAATSWDAAGSPSGWEFALLPGRYYNYFYGSNPGTITTNRKEDGTLYPGGQTVTSAQAGGPLPDRVTLTPSPFLGKTSKILIWTPPEYLSQGIAVLDGVDVPVDYRRGGVIRSAINGTKVWGYGERPAMLAVGSNVTIAHIRITRSAGLGLTVRDNAVIHAFQVDWCSSHGISCQSDGSNKLKSDSEVSNNIQIKYLLAHHNLDRVKNGETADGFAVPYSNATHVQYALSLFNGDDGMEFMYARNCEIHDSICGWSGCDVTFHNYTDALMDQVYAVKTNADVPRWASNHPLGYHGNGNGFKMGGNVEQVNTNNSAYNVLAFGTPVTGITSNSAYGIHVYSATILGSYDGDRFVDNNDGLVGGPYGALVLKNTTGHTADGVLSNYRQDVSNNATITTSYFKMNNSEFKSVKPGTPGFGEAKDMNKKGWRAPGAGTPPTPPDVTPPSIPTGFTATPQDGSVRLDWTDPPESDLASIKIWRKQGYTYDFTDLDYVWLMEEGGGTTLTDSIAGVSLSLKDHIAGDSTVSGTRLSRLWRDGRGAAIAPDIYGVPNTTISLPNTGYTFWFAFKRNTSNPGTTAVWSLGSNGAVGLGTPGRVMAAASYGGTPKYLSPGAGAWDTQNYNIICIEVTTTGYNFYSMNDTVPIGISSMTLIGTNTVSGALDADTVQWAFAAKDFTSYYPTGALVGGMGIKLGIAASNSVRNATARAFLERWLERSGSGGDVVDELPPPTSQFDLPISGHYFTNTFLLADTAWFLNQYTPPELATYLNSRVSNGFNMILGGILVIDNADYNGNHNTTPSKTDSEWYQIHDAAMQAVEDRGLWYFVPVTWGGWAFSANTLFPTTQAAYDYGAWIASRYKHHKNLIWSPVNEWSLQAGSNYSARVPYVNALANGIKSIIPNAVITEHGEGRLYVLSSTSPTFGSEAWLTFNGIQTGQTLENMYKRVYDDFNFTPVKPTMILEGTYESSGKTGDTPQGQRRQLWHSTLSGSAGFTYGNNYVYKKSGTWSSHLNDTATQQMRHVKTFLNALPNSLQRIPGQSSLVDSNNESDYTVRKTLMRDSQGKWLAAYLPGGGSVTINTSVLSGSAYSARWFNTSTGVFSSAGTGTLPGNKTFTASTSTDIVLLIEASGTPPTSNMTVMLVTTSTTPNTEESDIISGLTNLGYTVSTVSGADLSASASAYSSYGFIAVSDYPSKTYFSKLANKTTPIMNFKSNNDSMLFMDMLEGTTAFTTETTLKISNNTHPITSTYTTNQNLQVYSTAPTSGMRAVTLTGTSGQQLTTLAVTTAGLPCLLVAEVGATSPNGTYASRRAHMFVSRAHSDLNTNGWTLIDRTAKWLKGDI